MIIVVEQFRLDQVVLDLPLMMSHVQTNCGAVQLELYDVGVMEGRSHEQRCLLCCPLKKQLALVSGRPSCDAAKGRDDGIEDRAVENVMLDI